MKTYFWKFLFDYTVSAIVLLTYLLIFIILFPGILIYSCYKEKEIPGVTKYVWLLLISNTMTFIGSCLAIILPIFAKDQFGWCDNHHLQKTEPRLYTQLSWFQTPDNSLWGDAGWQNEHCVEFYKTYWGKAAWLVRNKCYGFSWTVLSAKVEDPSSIIWKGTTSVDKNYPENVGKTFFAQMGDYFEWKAMWKIPFVKRTFIIKIGWLLDSYISDPFLNQTQPNALFLFSPRIGKSL